MRGVPAWHRRHFVQHPSTVLALCANPPSPTGGEGKKGHLRLAKRDAPAILAAKIISHTGKLVSRIARLR
ncbi:hypothetical protein B5V02_25890 [Mesorhizobium kowhaii]|uniref:Transposase n=1 Tax=Mesorhizobium kowhaii TaxID=1300272 RepID=A0A2W7DWF4_9HYPH|nr:hypothetical protein B5V02_25890 [Mesorhizobium kowhaii]